MKLKALSIGVGAFLATSLLGRPLAVAGGGPLNVLVLGNGAVPASMKLAEHYAQARELPPGHVCEIRGLPPDPATYPDFYVDMATFQTKVAARLDECLAALPHPEDIDVLVTTKDLPWTVRLEPQFPPAGKPSGYTVGFESLLQIHRAVRKSDGRPLAGQPQFFYADAAFWLPTFLNPAFVGGAAQPGDYPKPHPQGAWYASATAIVRSDEAPPSFRRSSSWMAGREKFPGVVDETYDYSGNLFVVSRVDAFTFDEAHALIDRGVAADGTRPTGEILCMAAEDDNRSIRDPECEFATRHLTAAGLPARFLTPFDGELSARTLGAYFTGAANLRGAIAGNTFTPGALVSSLTSAGNVSENFACDATGATCPGREEQTSNARFIRAGATAVFGTVTEPTGYTFVNAGALLHYTMGYSVGESVLFNLRHLYWQALLVGDPLTTPYDERPRVTVRASADRRTLTVAASHPRGVAKTAIYVDGRRIGANDGADLLVKLAAPLGSEHVLAVAVAKNAPVLRRGWPSENPLPRTDVQGWTSTVMPPLADPSDGGSADASGASDAGGSREAGGSGCACSTVRSQSGGAGLCFGVLCALVARRRSRRSAYR